ncbi:hypothetical protein E2C01_007345 [Portunus trituberculatus]|uniref:Uncharacterized protein n=1 Tax=Portunus trituberculatus TaxID=210409 RepID=A0A5B7CXN3_PORTR|nr:hypothetical protein [Portunus trituberculatus]
MGALLGLEGKQVRENSGRQGGREASKEAGSSRRKERRKAGEVVVVVVVASWQWSGCCRVSFKLFGDGCLWHCTL